MKMFSRKLIKCYVLAKSFFLEKILGNKKPNDLQLKHAAGTFRGIALAILGLLFVPAFLKEMWMEVLIYGIQSAACELIALRLLSNVED